MSRRRNPEREKMSPTLKTALVVAGGVALGGAIGYAIASSRQVVKVVDAFGDEFEKWRLPDPSYAMRLPLTADEFETLDEVACEVGGPILQADQSNDPEVVADQIRVAIARELYPDFRWPPVPGDHPSVSQLWLEIGVLARRAVVTATICEPSALPSGGP